MTDGSRGPVPPAPASPQRPGLPARPSASGPPTPGSVRHDPTIPLAHEHDAGPALPPPSLCAGAGGSVPGPRSALARWARPLPAEHLCRRFTCTGLCRLSPRINPEMQCAGATTHPVAFLHDSVPTSRETPAPGLPSHSLLSQIHSLFSPPVIFALWLQDRAPANPPRVLSPSKARALGPPGQLSSVSRAPA